MKLSSIGGEGVALEPFPVLYNLIVTEAQLSVNQGFCMGGVPFSGIIGKD